MKAVVTELNPVSGLFKYSKDAYYVDSFCIGSNKTEAPIEELYARLMSYTPKWFDILMKLRDGIVSKLGLQATTDIAANRSLFQSAMQKFDMKNERVPSQIMDFFTIESLSANEIIFTIDDKHLTLRASLLRTDINFEDNSCKLFMSDVIHVHNLFGKAYLFFILPIHKLIIKKMLNDAKMRGDI